MSRKKTQEERIRELELFHEKVIMGQRWLVCITATIGGIAAFIYYVLSSWSVLMERLK